MEMMQTALHPKRSYRIGPAAPLLVVPRPQLDVPVLRFHRDWSVSQHGRLLAGHPAIIRYAPERMPRLRDRSHSVPAWNARVHLHGPGSHGHNVRLPQVYVAPNDTMIVVPMSSELLLWFSNDLGSGSEWDSNFGHNFRFPVHNPPAATLHFHADYTERADGPLIAGEPVTIAYDIRRLPDCRATVSGYPTWDVVVHYAFDGGPASSASLTRVVNTFERAPTPVKLPTPRDARLLSLWFENRDHEGRVSWDSRHGEDYHFPLE